MTKSLIDLLAANDTRANFFLLGRRVVRDTEIVDRLKRSRHELGAHTYDHLHAWKTRPSRAAEDIDKGYVTMAPWIPPDGLFRPPYGKFSYTTWRAVKRRGAKICWWTLDSGDTWPILPSPERTVNALVRAGGGVVLMHDFDRGSERENFVLQTTEMLLETACREEISVMTMSQLFSDDHVRENENPAK